MCDCKCEAIITGSISWMDMFDYWWDNTGVKLLPSNTPPFMIEKYKTISMISWNAAQDSRDRTNVAVVVRSGYPSAH